MRRPRRPVSFVVALAYIGRTCRGTGLFCREHCRGGCRIGSKPGPLATRRQCPGDAFGVRAGIRYKADTGQCVEPASSSRTRGRCELQCANSSRRRSATPYIYPIKARLPTCVNPPRALRKSDGRALLSIIGTARRGTPPARFPARTPSGHRRCPGMASRRTCARPWRHLSASC